MRTTTLLRVEALLCALLVSTPVWAQTGVSDDRVSLPEGPGSLEGVGENVSMSGNMGSLSHRVPFQLPKGFQGATPALSLVYNSGGSAGCAGMGWMLDGADAIERMTYRGVPQYDLDDDFALLGSTQLVRLPGTDPPVYRERFESSFKRYTWLDAGDGSGGYWRVEDPDGAVSYYGARADGTVVPEARVEESGSGTFRYHLVERYDVFGHAVRYAYTKDGRHALLTGIGWVYRTDPTTPRYSVELSYEERARDGYSDYLSDAGGGFEVLLTQRLRTVTVRSGATAIRRYELSYEDYADAGGFTRLASVELFGRNGTRYPIAHSFAYTQSLGGSCTGVECLEPRLVSMGNLALDLKSGQATLVDINGDALPDVLHTPDNGRHRFYLNRYNPDGAHGFDASYESDLSQSNGLSLAAGSVQVLDVNGDGFTDLINASTGDIFVNTGQGDWSEATTLGSVAALPDLDADLDVSDGELTTLRFIDYDNDKRIDLLQSTPGSVTVYRNGANGFETDTLGDVWGVDLASDALDMADMNGDGLLDLVQLLPGQIRYRLNAGWGRFLDWKLVDGMPFTSQEYGFVELQDLNGDGLADVVVVAGNEVRWALARNEDAAWNMGSMTAVDGQVLPQRTLDTTVLYADMNANGSQDVVWIDGAGEVTYLELFPVRPNLLTRIENGIGMVQDVAWTTSAEQMARDGGPEAWQYRLPYPMAVVASIDIYDELTDQHDVEEFTYRDGYYDGIEKQFRGFALVAKRLPGDDQQEEGLTESTYEVGADDRYRKQLMVAQTTSSAERVIADRTWEFTDCPLEGVPAPDAMPDLAIRYVCHVATETVIKEGASAEEWVTTRVEHTYDGYGNRTLSAELGVVARGGGGCASCDRPETEFGTPCDATCWGDEKYTETTFVPPTATGGRWILRKPSEQRVYGRPGSARVAVSRTYYDGPAFTGLPAGELSEGKVTRVDKLVDGSGRELHAERFAHDEDGNVVQLLDPLGVPNGDERRRAYVYDQDGLRVVQVDMYLEDAVGQAYQLRQTVEYERDFDQPVRAHDWVRVVDGAVTSQTRETLWSYDEFGRVATRVEPGEDTLESPTESYVYELTRPSPRIVVRKRSQAGGDWDIEEARCHDGRGREIQRRTQVSEGNYHVTGFTLYSERSAKTVVYQPYRGASAACDAAPPDGTLATRTRYDVHYRPVEVTHPDAEVYGGEASTVQTAYGPLTVTMADEEDSDPQSPHAGTVTVRFSNGLEKVTAVERRLADGTTATTTMAYDSLGHLQSVTDADGHVRRFERDFLGRPVTITDPNATAPWTQEHDDANNLVATTDPRGITTRTRYDGQNRPLATWRDGDETATRIAWTYDVAPDGCAECTFPEGRIASVTYPLAGLGGNGVGEERFGYDGRGRTSWTSRRLGDAVFALTTTYDNADRAVEVTYPGGRSLTVAYDGMARATSVSGVIEGVAYTDRGLVDAMQLTTALRREMRYDARMRLVADEAAAGGTALHQLSYEYDRVGTLLALTDGRPGDSGLRLDGAFMQDAWYRLTEASFGDGETMSYGFDRLDNVTARTSSRGAESRAHQGAFVAHASRPNALASVGDLGFTYTAAGQVEGHGDKALTWDYQGRLTEVSWSGGAEQHFFGADEKRVARVLNGDGVTHYVAPGYDVRDGIGYLYVDVAGHKVARLASPGLAAQVLGDPVPDGVVNAGDAWVARRSGEEPGRMLRSAARRMLVEAQPEATYLFDNHLGTPVLATDGEGAMLGRRAYYPTGALRDGATGFVDAYGFHGAERDPSGFDRRDFRAYDPATGRWLSLDPAFLVPEEKSLTEKTSEVTAGYAFVGNRFVDATDASGLWFNIASAQRAIQAIRRHITQNSTQRQNADIAQNPGNIVIMRVTFNDGRPPQNFLVLSYNLRRYANNFAVNNGQVVVNRNVAGNREGQNALGRLQPHRHRRRETEAIGLANVLASNQRDTIARVELYSERPFCTSCGGPNGGTGMGVLEQFHSITGARVEAQGGQGRIGHRAARGNLGNQDSGGHLDERQAWGNQNQSVNQLVVR